MTEPKTGRSSAPPTHIGSGLTGVVAALFWLLRELGVAIPDPPIEVALVIATGLSFVGGIVGRWLKKQGLL
jgi:hypothetical protein